MTPDEKLLRETLRLVAEKKITSDEAVKRLSAYSPSEHLGYATIDHHRRARQGFPEVVYCEGKTEKDAVEIIKKIAGRGGATLATRASGAIYLKVKKFARNAVFHERSRAITIESAGAKKIGKILVVSAGTSDVPVAEEAAVTASVMGSSVETVYDVGVAGIHRLFNHVEKLKDARAIVVVAGMDGALASVVGGLVPRPVVAVPTSVGYGASFGGLSALLAMLNSCAAGVAVMNIDNGFGAGALAHRINTLPETLAEEK
ncbi:MAG: nickel pincer cofactor biosynthesis protein LarB [Nitrospinae bacterium]|nr:nickel pincer cofactor biosynthesis protein LarB [Nitrospinota bacterium]MBF0633558.1 nickel pincer cofactor biosynthesis protein LarB [Nitrospinota bacterium]